MINVKYLQHFLLRMGWCKYLMTFYRDLSIGSMSDIRITTLRSLGKALFLEILQCKNPRKHRN